MYIASKKIETDFATILDNVVRNAHKERQSIAKNKKEIVIGDLIVMCDKKPYCIYKKNTNVILFDDIFLVDSAVLIAKYIQSGNSRIVKKVIKLEQEYSKHYLDIKFYIHSYRHAKNIRDCDKMGIMETRYRLSQSKAHKLKYKIKKMCDSKVDKKINTTN